ncbi:nitrogen regulation protein NR(II) [Malonomonas rubra]|uniref:two-component system sensor histidine kinase NtrB n=1 Tax=Malonomonas rubra TaxID=57040 RepID=UPI0026F12221|nr:ATP-binding protein [Malonomonas rubra]
MPTKNRPSSREYAMILENIEDAVIALDQQGIISLFNPAAQNYIGMSEKQCIGRLFFERFGHQKILCKLARTTLDKGRSISDHEAVVLRMPGTKPRPVSTTVSPIFASNGVQQGAVMILRDLTQVRTLEETLKRADRLSMVGTMAAGLAHEIKNPLGGIKGAAQLLQMELGKDNDLQEYTQLMIRETERVNRIIEELLDLSRPRKPQPGKVNISQVLDEIVMLQKQAVAERAIRFKLHLDPSIPDISGDRDLLVRLFLNLIKNAGEASPNGGRVNIESRIDSEYHMSFPGAKPTPMVLITISDDGPGIPQQKLEQIFTPFYTTKDGGSGLGLPICQKIVTDHGGFMQFVNRTEGGTAVKVSLPLISNRENESNINS